MSKDKLVLSTTNKKKLRRYAEEIGIVNDDQSFDEFLSFLTKLVAKRV